MDETLSEGDLSLSGDALVEGDDLHTMVLLSLFCDAPAREGDPVHPSQPRNGFWGDVYSGDNDTWGSRLWILRRAKLTLETKALAKQYTAEALAWMVADGLASKIEAFSDIVRINGVRAIVFGADIYAPNELTPTRVGPWELLRSAA